MIRFLLALALLSSSLIAQDTAATLARRVRDAGLDPEQCYRIRDLNFNREDVKFYLNDGLLIFARPVGGRRLVAVFSGEIEGGDAELILMPPLRSERQSLGTFTNSPNLDEHFKTALLVFSDDFGNELLERAKQSGKPSPEEGLMLDSRYSSTARNVAEGFQMRLVEDLLNPMPGPSLFFATIGVTRLGNFDVIHDPRGREQILVGQFHNRNNQPGYDIWTSFEARSVRKRTTPPPEPPVALADYRIEASMSEDLHLTAVTKFKVTPARRTRALLFQISENMRVTGIRLDGKPAELYTAETLRAAALRAGGSIHFLAVAPDALEAGSTHEVEIDHDGDVVMRAGNGVFAVGARGTWYPYRISDFTTYDITFRYPKSLTLVSTGEVVEDRTEGDQRITRRRTSGLARFAGFNLGQYDKVSTNRAGYTIEVFGNRRVEPPLEQKPMPMPPQVRIGRHIGSEGLSTIDPVPTNPTAYLNPLAEEVSGAFEFMTKQFGPPPLKTLTVSPIPGAFGQGFPGLVYLSTIAYLAPEQRPTNMRDKPRQTFFSDMLAPHEVAHQWWGNLVTAEAYQDAWLMEALANYSALLYLEKRKGTKALEAVLEEYRINLLGKREGGATVESLGPITWGTRLQSTEATAARLIVYEKGSWILHMLRLRMGNERFLKMLNEICKRYKYKSFSTTAFRTLIEEFLPPGKTSVEGFFDSWIYGTGVPAFKLTSATKGAAPNTNVTITVKQSDVDNDFSIEVPVEIHFPSGPPMVKWIATADEPVSMTVKTRRVPSKVILSSGAVLAKH